MIDVLLLALALSADAFAAALGQGAVMRMSLPAALRIGAAFGAAQAIMPLFGWALGIAFATVARDVDHWLAFGLLGLIGLRMMRAGLSDDTEEAPSSRSAWGLFALAVATSIDAAAAGVTIPALGQPAILVCATIGVVTFALSAIGVMLGSAAGSAVGKRAEFLGGLVLIGLGIRILIEHGVRIG